MRKLAMLSSVAPDEQFEEYTLTGVRQCDTGWEITHDRWTLYMPECGITPKVGDLARYYGSGIGSPVRGLSINGATVYYRTEAEDAEKQEIDLYGVDAADWLKRWDEGRSVWSIEMGGLGPGYEQCIHITAAEILRHLLDKKYDHTAWSDAAVWKRDRDIIEAAGHQNAVIKELGLSGAQWGGAMNLAVNLYRQGPRAIMADERVKDRHIQVMKNFPQGSRRELA